MEGTRPVAFHRWRGSLILAQQRGVYALTPARPESLEMARLEPLPFPAPLQPAALAVVADHLLVAADNGLHALSPDRGPAQTLLPDNVRFVIALPDEAAALAFTEREIIRIVRTPAGWQSTRARHALPFAFDSAAWDRDGTLWLAAEVRGFVALRAGAAGWPESAIENEFGAGANEPDVFRVTQGPRGALLATEAGLFSSAFGTRQLTPDPRGRLWAGTGDLPRTLEAQADGALWVQLHRPSRVGQSELLLLAEDGRILRSVAPEPIGLVEYGGVRLLHSERVDGRDYLWAGGLGGLMRGDWNNPPPVRPTLAPLLDVGVETNPIDDEAGRPVFLLNRRPLRFRFAMPVSYTGAAWEFETRLAGFDDAWSSRHPRLRPTPPEK